MVWQAWRGKEIPGQSWYGTVSPGKAGKASFSMVGRGLAGRGERWTGRLESRKEEINLVYQFKLPGLYPVSAQTAGEELRRIYADKGQLKPADVVDESRPTSAPLHPCFEWDDEVAAEKYREVQAGNLIRSITVVHKTPTHEPVEVRAFVKPLETYAPIEVVVNSEEQIAALLETALAELKTFEKKYATLSKLSPIFEEIKKLTA